MTTGSQIQALTDTSTTFTTAIDVLGATTGGGGDAGGAQVPVHDLYQSSTPFDLTTFAGLDALKEISKSLDHIWDGSSKDISSILVALRLGANKGH